MGELEKQSLEDEMCAQYIKNRLEDKQTDIDNMKQKIRKSEWTLHLINSDRGKDVDFCLEIDKYKVVPKLTDGEIKV